MAEPMIHGERCRRSQSSPSDRCCGPLPPSARLDHMILYHQNAREAANREVALPLESRERGVVPASGTGGAVPLRLFYRPDVGFDGIGDALVIVAFLESGTSFALQVTTTPSGVRPRCRRLTWVKISGHYRENSSARVIVGF